MGSTDNAAASTVAKVSSNAGTGFDNNPGGEFDTSPAPAMSSGLSGSVGIGGANAPDDIFQVSSALSNNGLMEAPQDTADSTLYSGIISAQESMDSTLKRDGLVNPDGPTQQTYAHLAGQGFVKPAQPATSNAADNAAIRAEAKQDAVTAAEAKSRMTMGDVTRTGFQQVQDVKRVQKAKTEAKRAEDRAQALKIKQRETAQHKQLKVAGKARATVQKQTSQQTSQLGQKIGQTIGQTLKSVLSLSEGEALNEPQNPSPGAARHPLPLGEVKFTQDEGPGTVVPPLPKGEGQRRDKREGPSTATILSDETIQSNQRLADSLKKRDGVGDLPKFTVDAINTNGDKAIPEIINLLHEVDDPAQVQELFQRTFEGVKPEHQKQFEDAYVLSLTGGEDERLDLTESVEDAFGLEADVERPEGMLPMPDKIDPDGKGIENIDWSNWTAPEWVHEGAKAIALPKHVFEGGKWSASDVTKAALATNVGSAASSAPAGTLRSGVTRLRGTPKFMRKVDLEKQGQDAAKKAMDDTTSVPQAMFREDVGEITFDYGSPKLGLQHIRSGRMRKDGMSEEEAMAFIQKKVPEILAHGKLAKHVDRVSGRRAEITYKNNRVVLALDRSGNRESWVITGYEDW